MWRTHRSTQSQVSENQAIATPCAQLSLSLRSSVRTVRRKRDPPRALWSVSDAEGRQVRRNRHTAFLIPRPSSQTGQREGSCPKQNWLLGARGMSGFRGESGSGTCRSHNGPEGQWHCRDGHIRNDSGLIQPIQSFCLPLPRSETPAHPILLLLALVWCGRGLVL